MRTSTLTRNFGVPGHKYVVSNTTPLISLVGVGLLDLLPTLYGDIWAPQAVYREYQNGRVRHPNSPDLDALPWFSVHVAPLDTAVPPTLDAGETEIIALARSCSPHLVLLDEQRGRNVAMRLGLPVAGSLTVLLEAKQMGLLQAITPIVDQMIAQGRWISPALRARVLQMAGE
jgi:predicted nucleic acid-binding protein